MNVTFISGVALGLASCLFLDGAASIGQHADKGPSLDELVSRLQGSNFGVRFRTLSEIGAMKYYPKEIAPHVIRLLKDPNFHIRSNAAEALGNLQNALPDLGTRFPESVPQLMLLLSDRDPEDKHQLVRRCAAYALRHLGPASKAAVPELLKIAVDKEENAAVRTEAVQALGEIGHASPEVVAALIKLLDDPSRINENYPTIGRTANSSLGRLKANAKAALPVLLQRLRLKDAGQRAAAAQALGPVGFGSLEVENALLELLDDTSVPVQDAALSSLEGINETYAFFFRHNVSSREVDAKRQALLAEIRRDAARKARFAKILAAQVRLGEEHHPKRDGALRILFELDARDYVPMLKEQFARLEKKVIYLEWADLRMQLLRVLAAWLPEKEAAPFLMSVDSDADEAPEVRFRAAVLLCERGDTQSVSHIVKLHSAEAKKTKPLMTVETIQKSLKDRQLFASDEEFNSLKAIGADELAGIQTGMQLAQHFYDRRRQGAIRALSVAKVHVNQGRIDSIRFEMTVPSEGWSFELRKKGEWWLPCNFRMEYIE